MIENKSLGSKFFDILNVVILIAITLICIVPVWYVLCVSLSSREAVNAGKVAFRNQYGMYPYGSISVIQNEKAVPEERYLYVDLRILYVIQRRYGSVVYHHEKL